MNNTVPGTLMFSNHNIPQPWTILVCLLGTFRVLNAQQAQLVCSGDRAETLLAYLAVHHRNSVPREQLMALLWPDGDPLLASQSLNSLIYAVRKSLKDELDGASPVVQVNGCYRLNYEAGMSVDVVQFETFAQAGDHLTHIGQESLAGTSYHRAIDCYQGDLCLATDTQSLIERERLRARFLTLLMRIADDNFSRRDYRLALAFIQRLLLHDPCREDAHRLAMRCYVHLGERAQAFRQYQLCQRVLQIEFGTEPESPTVALFEQIRLDPAQV